MAASIMERAARLSRDPAARVRRLVETYSLATFVCDPVWVESLATEIATLTDDARLLQQTALSAAWALAATSRQGAAVSRMIPLAAATVESDPVMALGALTKGAIALYYTGEEAYRRQAAELLARIPVDVGDPMDQVWARVCADPFTDRAGHLDRLRAATDRAGLVVEEYTTLGGAAWMLDETPLALRLLAAGADRAQATPDAVANPTLTQALALAQFESGAWEAASATAHRARRGAAEAGIGMPGRVAAYVSAALHVHRGEPVDARRALEQARSGVDLTQLRGLDASCRGVEAAAATAEGKHILAYALLRSVFTGSRTPGRCTTTPPTTRSAIWPRRPYGQGRARTPGGSWTRRDVPWPVRHPRGWRPRSPVPGLCWPPTLRRSGTSRLRCRRRRGIAGPSSGRWRCSSTANGCGGGAVPMTRAPGSLRPSRCSSAWPHGPGPIVQQLNYAPAAASWVFWRSRTVRPGLPH
ncbi:hypothetical protein ACFQZC_01105 [Streptacidiphilus monticola]